MAGFGSVYDRGIKIAKATRDAPYTEADAYRAALEKAAYGDAGREYGQGLDQITNYLARSGPMADSGGATALKYKLASNVYGQARSRIQGGYAEMLKQLLLERQRFAYQQKQAKDNKPKWWQSVLGAAGGVAGAAF